MDATKILNVSDTVFLFIEPYNISAVHKEMVKDTVQWVEEFADLEESELIPTTISVILKASKNNFDGKIKDYLN